jgi:tetratricopeptide (TPR) repeat protein
VEAAPLYKQVLEGQRARLGPDHRDTLGTMANLALVYHHLGRYDEAELLFKQALKGLRTKVGSDHRDTLRTMNNLASLYHARGRYDEAEPLFREALTGARRKLGLSHPDTQNYINNLSDLYSKQGKPERGEPLLRELATYHREHQGPDSSTYARQLARLVLNQLEQKNGADAEALARECLAIRQKMEPDAWTTFNVESMLGEALLGQKRYAEAEPLLLEGYRGMKEREAKIDKSSKDRLTEALQRLVGLYEATGKKDEAAKWRKKVEEASKAAANRPPKP